MEHIQGNTRAVCELIDQYLDIMSDPERLEKAPLNQIASSLGVLIDKFSKNTVKEKENTELDKVLEAVREIE